jgi:hypothetical protein
MASNIVPPCTFVRRPPVQNEGYRRSCDPRRDSLICPRALSVYNQVNRTHATANRRDGTVTESLKGFCSPADVSHSVHRAESLVRPFAYSLQHRT